MRKPARFNFSADKPSWSCGYGERFGMADAQLAPLVAGVRSRQQLIAECDVIVLP